MNTVRLQPDPTQAPTKQIPAFQFPGASQNQKQLDPYAMFNDLLDAKLIACVVQFRKLKFGVKHFFVLRDGWLECVVDDEELGEGDDIRITIKQGLPMIIYVVTGQFMN